MRVLDVGVDIGTHRVAIACSQIPYAASLDYSAAKFRSRMSREEELRRLAEFAGHIGDTREVRLWIEKPYLSGGPGSNATTTIGMAETVGAIRAAGPWLDVELVVPNSWKASVLQDARADKEAIQYWLHENVPHLAACCSTEDEYDAMAISIYGDGRARGEILPPEPKKPKKRAARKG